VFAIHRTSRRLGSAYAAFIGRDVSPADHRLTGHSPDKETQNVSTNARLVAPLVLFVCATSTTAQTQPAYKVGTAEELITPCTPALQDNNDCRPGFIDVDVDLNLAGNGNTNNATSLDSELLVRVLAIEDLTSAQHHLVLVSVDVGVMELSFIADIRNQVRGYHGLRPEEVMINASHTHSAPSMHLFCPGLSCPTDEVSNPSFENPVPNDAYVESVKAKINRRHQKRVG
jgi:hypothetical protein